MVRPLIPEICPPHSPGLIECQAERSCLVCDNREGAKRAHSPRIPRSASLALISVDLFGYFDFAFGVEANPEAERKHVLDHVPNRHAPRFLAMQLSESS